MLNGRRSPALISVLSALLTTAALPALAGTTLDQIKARGYVRAATANEVPYGFMDTDGKAKGIAPEVAEAVFKKLGVNEVQWVVTPFGSLIPGLKADRFDVVGAEQDILPERCKQVEFSNPNSSYGDGLLVKAGNAKSLHAYEDVKKDPSVKLAVVNGTSHLTFAETLGIPEEQLVVISNKADAPATIQSGRADAYAATEGTVIALTKNGAGLALAQPFTDPIIKGKPTRSYGGFSFQLGSDDLVKAFDKELAAFKQTPEYKAILIKYDVSEGSIQASMSKSTQDLCAGK